jgi:hypothetical protein
MSSSISYTVEMNNGIARIVDAAKYEAKCKAENCFELIPDDTPVKMYFDVDIKRDVEDGAELMEEAPRLLEGIISYLDSRFVNAKYAIATCHSPGYVPFGKETPIAKASFRIIIDNYLALKRHQKYIVGQLNEQAHLSMDADDLGLYYKDGVFDTAVYNNGKQKIRSVYASKPTENRPLIIQTGTFEQMCITSFISPDAEVISVEDRPVKKHTGETTTTEGQNNLYRDIFYRSLEAGLLDKYAKGTYKLWFTFGCIIKNVFDDVALFHLFSKLDTERYDRFKVDEQWDKIEKKEIGAGWASFIYYIKEADKKKASDILYIAEKELSVPTNKYFISETDLANPYDTAVVISKTLKTTLVLCRENWYMLTESQLWKHQKEPTFYVLTELRKYIDESIREIGPEKASEVRHIIGPDGKSIVKPPMYSKSHLDILEPKYLSALIKCLKTLLVNNEFADKLDSNKGFLAFKNGIMNLETGVFRDGIFSSDYITQTIPYDYSPADEDKKAFVKSVLLKILNNNPEHLEYFLSLIGYTFIGEPHLEKSIYFCVDKTLDERGDNGKSFFFNIINTLLPNYVYKTKGSFLEESNKKVHKQLANMKGKRLVWLDEFSENKANSELMKEIGDGQNTENEILFGTSETINIMFKVFALTNHLPTIDAKDTAVYNRYKQISYGSHFDRTGQRTIEDADNLLFIADKTLVDKIKAEYYNEVFGLIIEYAHKYYTRGLPAIPSQFIKDTKATQQKNDMFGQWFEENCIVDVNGRISFQVIIDNSEMDKKFVKEGMARLGFKYDKDLRKIGKDRYGKAYKGGFIGAMLKPRETEDDDTDIEYIEE